MRIILPFLLILTSRLNAQQIQFSEIDVLHYQAEIEPDISRKTIIGSVTITFKVVTAGGKITFDCGDLQIESIQSNGKQLPFEIRNRKVSIDPGVMVNQSSDIVIHYHGAPTRGINFFPNQEEVYTVFTTSEWLVCKDQPDDKATLALKITIPSTLKAVGSGELRKQTRPDGDKIVIEWNLQQPFPTYTYGFAIGPYNEFVDSSNDLTLRYLSAAYTSTELEKIFAETRSIIQFFEQRSGVKYHSNLYAQVLGEGNVSQEMAGFTVMRLNYGKQVLDNSTDINLAAHELAHQWWGNRVTCVNWNHFWLNEGFAVFMSSAYKEFKFGHDHYLKDITTYQDAYQAVVKKGLDKPLTFPSWLNPTGDDRTLVYYKGAYVLHLLREQLGEKAFWDGVKLYTSAYVGKSVTAKEFRQVMEKVSGQDLGLFFSKWIEGRR